MRLVNVSPRSAKNIRCTDMNLSNNNIDDAVENIRNFFQKAGVSHKDDLKICLVVEEALLRCQDEFGEAQDFELYMKKWFSAPKVIIRLKGKPFNPLEDTQDDSIFSSEIMRNLLQYDAAGTVYRYENGHNELVAFSTRERKPLKIPGGAITVAIVLAIICSFLANFLEPSTHEILINDVVAPILSTLMQLIITVMVFMMFFSIVSSICAIENSTMLSNIGKTVLSRFFLLAIFLCIFKTLSTNSLADFLIVWKLIAADFIAYVAVILAMLLYMSLTTRTNLRDFLKTISSAVVIALTTSSSLAAFPKNLDLAEKNLHIEEKSCAFWLPIALVMFAPSTLIEIVIAAFYVMSITGNTISIMQLLVIAFLAIQLSIATPKVAGGMAASFGILLTQLGLPTDMLGLLMVASVLTDNIFSAFNVLAHDCELMSVAHKMSFINSEVDS